MNDTAPLLEVIWKMLAVISTLVSVLLTIVWKQMHERISDVEEDVAKIHTRIDRVEASAKDDRHGLRDLLGTIVNEQNAKNIAFARELGQLAGRGGGARR